MDTGDPLRSSRPLQLPVGIGAIAPLRWHGEFPYGVVALLCGEPGRRPAGIDHFRRRLGGAAPASVVRTPWLRGYVVMLAAGLAIGVSIEWAAVHVAGRWAYNAQMPLVPGLGVGLVSVAQMLVLPPLIFRVAAIWLRRQQ